MFLHVRSFHLYKVKAHIMTRSLVTGGAGFIGSHLTQRLLDRGESVLVVDDLSTGRLENLLPFIEKYENFEFREGTITDEAFLCQAMEGIDTVYHLAAAVGVKLVAENPVRTIETNIAPTEVLLKQATLNRQKVFLASTSEVYGKNPASIWSEEDDLCLGPTSRPRWAYGCSKAIDEFLALAYLAWVAAGDKGARLLARGTGAAARFWSGALAVILKVGQQSLAVFVASMFMARVMGFALDVLGRSLAATLLVNLIGAAILIAVAYGAGWFKSQPWRAKAGA